MVGCEAGHPWFGCQVVQFDVVRHRRAEEDDIDLLLSQRAHVIAEAEVHQIKGRCRVALFEQAQDAAGVCHSGLSPDGSHDEPPGRLSQLCVGDAPEPVDSRDSRTGFGQQSPPFLGQRERSTRTLDHTYP